MKIWINKQSEDTPPKYYENAFVFNLLDKSNKSNVKTDVEELWQQFGIENVSKLHEDLLLIAISLFCADKRVLRGKFEDSWTRHIEMNIPVIELEKWNSVQNELEVMLGFLSGDIWSLVFRKSNERFRTNNKKLNNENIKNFDAVSLFSGGLDSFCGALKLMEDKTRTCFVGFREYNLISQRQTELFNAIDSYYSNINKIVKLFSVTPLPPLSIDGNPICGKIESTSRSRSFLFLSGAILVASMIGPEIPVYIPENGFIGINVPLTDSRNGSCSTRTTHVYFIKSFNAILDKLGIGNKISNFYAFKTKGEIVEEHKDNEVFKQFASLTISCSHPCLSRYDGYKPPKNCGYCYPCLIRKASLNSFGYNNKEYNPKYKLSKAFIEEFNAVNGKASDLKALLLTFKRYLIHKNDKNYIKHLLLKHGKLSIEELYKYEEVYIKSMEELLEMFADEDRKNNGGILDYLGSEKERENE
ncbi:Qat anti-phage system QueC-like protein QatC [Clostridium sp.]|uniref:Qat anti-phage system QueC-like protein QatC n=1 Tax=Clostridium sp. TaxID=1506 RepID=UPI002FC60789